MHKRYPIPRDKTQNIIHLLMDRESGIDRRHSYHHRSPLNFSLEFFKCIPPNLTISDIDKPTNYVRKFSPDGKYLICFSRDQQWFENYKFLGTTNACELLYKWRAEYVPPDNSNNLAREIRQNIFERMFKLQWQINLTSFMRPLYREFSIFTDDGIYVLIASYMPIHEENIPSYYALNAINRVQFDYDLHWYRFFLIKLSDGTISDTIEYTYDFISLSHNHGVSLRGNMMAVVSIFHQSINILQLVNGKFVKAYTVGKYPHGSPECICSHAPEYTDACMTLETGMSDLKRKVLIKLYKDIIENPDESSRSAALKTFYQRFPIYEAMELNKVQFIDEKHLLIRYDTYKKHINVPEKYFELIKFFVVYSLPEKKIHKIYNEKSIELLRIFTQFFDEFRNVRSMFTGRAPSSTSNNIYLQKSQKRLIASYPNGEDEGAYRLLTQLPISAQGFSMSPYLDYNLFNYDPRISALERPRFSSSEPLRFADRETDVTSFRIYPGIPELFTNEVDQNRLVAYIFHPFEPFAISVQKIANNYVTNFHIRNEGTRVRPGKYKHQIKNLFYVSRT